jgi:hypothetical protein
VQRFETEHGAQQPRPMPMGRKRTLIMMPIIY